MEHPKTAALKSDSGPQEHDGESFSSHLLSGKLSHEQQISSLIEHKLELKNPGSTDHDISPFFSNRFSKPYEKSITNRKRTTGKKGNSFPSRKRDYGSTRRNRPNHFVAIQITNSQIHHHVEMVQKHVLSQDSQLSSAMVPLPTLHITVLVTYLADQEQIDKAQSALKECRQKLDDLCTDPLVLHVKGVHNFCHNVVFANIEEGPAKQRLSSVADVVAMCFKSAGLPNSDDRDFSPHLTIMKLSQADDLRKRGIKKIDPFLYYEVRHDEFGLQTVQSLQLCAMNEPKDQHGYYQTVFEEMLVPAGRKLNMTQEATGACDLDIAGAGQELASDTIAMETIREKQIQNRRKRWCSTMSTHILFPAVCTFFCGILLFYLIRYDTRHNL